MAFSGKLADKARMHHDTMKERYGQEIFDCVRKGKIYQQEFIPMIKEKNMGGRTISLVPADSVSAAFNCDSSLYRKICILNYASYKEPGGYFLQGSAAQEEALCHKSILFEVLSDKVFLDNYYNINRTKLNKGLYLSTSIYTPDIIFEHNGEVRKFDVLSCAAPNYTTAHRYQRVTREQNKEVFKNRIDYMFRVAADNKIDTLITGAWGCGVFGQDPRETAQLMMEAIGEHNYAIKNIIFAIPDASSLNYRAFEEVLL